MCPEQVEYASEPEQTNPLFFNSTWENWGGVYDKVYSDGCLVHQRKLQKEFFRFNYQSCVNRALIKELHLAKRIPLSICKKLNKTFGGTGQYRGLDHDIRDLKSVGFKRIDVHSWPIENYIKTITVWLEEMEKSRDVMCAIDADKYELDVATWKLNLILMEEGVFRMDVLVCHR